MTYRPPTIGNIDPKQRAQLDAEQRQLTNRLLAFLGGQTVEQNPRRGIE